MTKKDKKVIEKILSNSFDLRGNNYDSSIEYELEIINGKLGNGDPIVEGII